jgi:2'-5' RNA ligase
LRQNKRLFFALLPEEKVRRQLADLQTQLPQTEGNRVHSHDLHMTLQFLGTVAHHQQACITEAADLVNGTCFDIGMTHLEYWSKPGMVMAVPRERPVELLRLVKALGENLKSCGFAGDNRSYRPHVTLLRKTMPLPKIVLAEPVCWRVADFVLLESRLDRAPPCYKLINSWSLG